MVESRNIEGGAAGRRLAAQAQLCLPSAERGLVSPLDVVQRRTSEGQGLRLADRNADHHLWGDHPRPDLTQLHPDHVEERAHPLPSLSPVCPEGSSVLVRVKLLRIRIGLQLGAQEITPLGDDLARIPIQDSQAAAGTLVPSAWLRGCCAKGGGVPAPIGSCGKTSAGSKPLDPRSWRWAEPVSSANSRWE